MDEKYLIKVCGMRNPENIKELVSLHPDFIGFIFYPLSKRFVDIKNAEQIIENIPAQIKKTGVFVNETYEKIIQIQQLFKLDFVQLHGNEDIELIKNLYQKNIKIIKTFLIDDSFDFSYTLEFSDLCDYFLFDTKTAQHGGSGQKFNWEKLNEYEGNRPFLLSGGITINDVEELLELDFKYLAGFDINSGFENAPAEKNIKLIEEFLQAIKK
jgi:phosphoribosylanthranilate isomerase